MEQLQIAISSGEHKKAALLAREAALRKVTCTLQRSTPSNAQPIVYVYFYFFNYCCWLAREREVHFMYQTNNNLPSFFFIKNK